MRFCQCGTGLLGVWLSSPHSTLGQPMDDAVSNGALLKEGGGGAAGVRETRGDVLFRGSRLKC